MASPEREQGSSDKIRQSGDSSLVEILSVAENSIHALKAVFDQLDSALFQEFHEIADHIANTKTEIGHLQASDIRDEKIPDAGRELHAVVGATEQATTRIMECAEAILDANSEDAEAYHVAVTDNILAIFEACAFQDITGQRIAKVVDTLEFIERRVANFAAAIGDHGGSGHISQEEARQDKRKKDLILNGPAQAGLGSSQDEIDALMHA